MNYLAETDDMPDDFRAEEFIENWRRAWLENYRRTPIMVREHVGIEETVLAGGYGYRQVLELVQNGADAVTEEADSKDAGADQGTARIHVLFDGTRLYVANTGAPLSREGIKALLTSHSSPKRGNQIGRFGIGFKSLLRLGGTIDILSRSDSLRFDPLRCQQEVRSACKLAANDAAPSLRLAWALDRAAEERQDPRLRDFHWATTVVRAEVKKQAMTEHLVTEIAEFPARFLLFISSAVDLTLESQDGEPRRIRRSHDGDAVVLHDGQSSSRWRLVERSVQVTEAAALADATHLHRRDEVPLTWAIPLDAGRDDAGRFWAFFPTQTPTRLPGILNAPWKVNSDRQSIIDGEWNRALMRETAVMIAGALPTLADADDPARALDYLPRQHDRNELAATLVDELWALATAAAIVPDAAGALRVGEDLRRPPSDDKDLVERWCALSDETQRAGWVHPDCLRDRERRARLGALAERLARAPVTEKPGLAQAKPADWFAEVASADTEQAEALIRLAADYASGVKRNEWTKDPTSNVWGREYIRPTLKIVPDRGRQLRCPDDIWLARPGQSVPDRYFVADALVSDPEIRQILRNTLEVRSLLEDDWLPILRQAIEEHIEQERKYQSAYRDWSGFWQTLRSARPRDQKAFADEYKAKVRIRRQDGTWQYPPAVLLPGEIVPATDPDPQNRKMLVDLEFHRDDEALLRLLGAVSKPEGKDDVLRDAEYWRWARWMDEDSRDWKEETSQAIRRKIPRVQPDSFIPSSIEAPAGCGLLPYLKASGNARLTQLLLSGADEVEPTLILTHRRNPDGYAQVEAEHPLRWLLRHFGSVAIGDVTVAFSTILARCDVPALGHLPELAPLLPTIQRLAGSPRLAPTSREALDAFWQALTDHLATREAIASDALAALWRDAAARDQWVPNQLPCAHGKVALSEVYVTGSADLARRARARGWTAVELDEETRALWRQQGALDLDVTFRRGWDEALASFNTLADALPELKTVLSDELEQQSYTQFVCGLHLAIDKEREPVPCLHWEGVLYLDQAQLQALVHRDRLSLVLAEAAAAGWLKYSPANALEEVADATLEERRRIVAAGTDLAERLLLAVAGDVDALREALGDAACRALPDDAAPSQVAALTLDLLGPAVLQAASIRAAVDRADLRPPSRWGTDEARAFVLALGFPDTFAQSQSRRLDAELWVAGPLVLPELHGYQVEVFESLKDLINSDSGRRRAVVSLPTGGGKTRVAVQAAVELILKPAGPRRIVLWIAQTNELCEQAVQSFQQVWQNLGTEGESLRVIRFWGGHGNPAEPANAEPTVVVASIQTLTSRFDGPALAWLAKPGLVVVDECHHAITPSYTSLLRWLDAEAPRPSAPPKDEPPLVGLSATPFRMDDEESRRLARRFDELQYPRDQEGLTERLLAGGFLARAEYQALETDTTVSADLLDDLDSLWDSNDGARFDGVLERVNQELAANDDRNARLIEALEATEARQILFFTNSVRHAKEMAARLCLLGIPAAAISGETPATARRWFLNRFKDGNLRVLCNHSVLATGFDAPYTDLVLIARQVQSPVAYMQMVGRALRGPRNGGTESCTILTVLDNLGRFRERHPFHYCQNLYRRG